MLKILTPNDLIIKEIERDSFLIEIVESINSKLTSVDEYPSDGFKFNITTSDEFTKRQRALLNYIYNIHGWKLYITSYGKSKNDIYHHTIFLIEQHKIILN